MGFHNTKHVHETFKEEHPKWIDLADRNVNITFTGKGHIGTINFYEGKRQKEKIGFCMFKKKKKTRIKCIDVTESCPTSDIEEVESSHVRMDSLESLDCSSSSCSRSSSNCVEVKSDIPVTERNSTDQCTLENLKASQLNETYEEVSETQNNLHISDSSGNDVGKDNDVAQTEVEAKVFKPNINRGESSGRHINAFAFSRTTNSSMGFKSILDTSGEGMESNSITMREDTRNRSISSDTVQKDILGKIVERQETVGDSSVTVFPSSFSRTVTGCYTNRNLDYEPDTCSNFSSLSSPDIPYVELTQSNKKEKFSYMNNSPEACPQTRLCEDNEDEALKTENTYVERLLINRSSQTSIEDIHESSQTCLSCMNEKDYCEQESSDVSVDGAVCSGAGLHAHDSLKLQTDDNDDYIEIKHDPSGIIKKSESCNSLCIEEDQESDECQESMVDVCQIIFGSSEYVTINLRDISYMAFADFQTLKLVFTLKYEYIVILDIEELENVLLYEDVKACLNIFSNENMLFNNECQLMEEATDSGNFSSESGNFSSESGNFSSESGNFSSESRNFSSESGNFSSESGNFSSESGNFSSESRNFSSDSKFDCRNDDEECTESSQHEQKQAIKPIHLNQKMKQSKVPKNTQNVDNSTDLSSKSLSRKRRWKSTQKENPSDDFLSDSSLEDLEPLERDTCSYCRKSLSNPNKRCKHHKQIRRPKSELNQKRSKESHDNLDLDGFSMLTYDSGISSVSTLTSSLITRFQHEHTKQRKNVLNNKPRSITKKYKKGKYICHRKISSNSFRSLLSSVLARERRRLIAKQIAREIHVDHRNLPVFGLGSYFDRLNNGPPPSTQERLQYEWLRLATFSNYTGNGNAIALARNGFYHDHSEGPSSTRCFMCEARNSDWERFDNVEVEHRRQSPNCPFHASRGQESVNIPISYENNDDGASEPRETTNVTSTSTTVTEVSTTSTAAVIEATRTLQNTQISDASMSGGESISQQPTEDPESRDRSLLAFSQPRQLRALGRTGNSYSTIIAPRRNNVAIGARSNVGIDPSRNGSSTSGTASQSPGRPSSVLGGPVGAGAFAGSNNGQQVPVSTTTESSQQSNVPSPAVEAAAGAGSGAGGRTDPTITVVVDNPKHPDYLNIETRVNSYHGWPDYLDQTARQMSEAGFFYVGVADFTRCFCCGGGLRNWEPGDDPMLEHTRWFPRCEYVNKLKGERYVAAVQRRHTEHMAEQQRQQLELAQRRDENRNPPDPMTTDAAAVMREMGYSIERTREAILAVRQQTGTVDVTTQQVLTWLLDYEERRLNSETSNTELGVRPPPSSSPTETTSVETSTPSTVVNTGTSSESSTVNTTSSTSTSSTVVSAGTTTSTVNTTSTMATAEVQQSGTSASSSTEGSESGTGNQQTGSAAGASNSSSSTSQTGTSEDKQPGASGGDSDEPKSTTEGTGSSETLTKSSKKRNTKKKAKNKASTKPGTSGATGSDIDAKSLKAENEKLREMQTCKICMERAVNTTLLPCGHLVCCDTCAARLQRCPICRKRIKGTVKTFMS